MHLRDDSGFTLVEITVVALVGSILLTIAGALLVTSFKAGLFTDGQVATLNDSRTAVERISKEIRGADWIGWCAATELPPECQGVTADGIVVGAQTALGGFRTVRYTNTSENLQREEFDDATETWSPPEVVIERVVNDASQPAFSCDTQSSLLKVNVDLLIQPTPLSDPVLNLKTSVRPRNFASKATCPS